jgi:hypothetical protein
MDNACGILKPSWFICAHLYKFINQAVWCRFDAAFLTSPSETINLAKDHALNFIKEVKTKDGGQLLLAIPYPKQHRKGVLFRFALNNMVVEV